MSIILADVDGADDAENVSKTTSVIVFEMVKGVQDGCVSSLPPCYSVTLLHYHAIPYSASLPHLFTTMLYSASLPHCHSTSLSHCLAASLLRCAVCGVLCREGGCAVRCAVP